MTDPDFDTKPKVKVKKGESINETIKTILYAVLIAIVVRTFTFQPYNIPSGSMIPTLLVGDYLFASKFAYGYSEFSFPIDLPLFKGRIFATPPTQGDVVIFKLPSDGTTDYIKRVIGMPGDKLKVEHGQLYINDKAVPREAMPDYVDDFGSHHRRFMETLPDGVKHQILQDGDDGPLDNCPGGDSCMASNGGGEYTVPAGYYFCMGDNRTNSADSRELRGVGYVPFVNLEAKATFIFFSLKEDAHFWEIWKWPFDLRLGRFFTGAQK
jgi:signal peptidase I